jgi:FtsZ-interacting cell division protein YlmF
MYGASTTLIAATWGPSLILVFGILLTVWLTREAWTRKAPERISRGTYHAIHSAGNSELSVALKSATALNAYSVGGQNNPSVYLGATVRFIPLDYENSVRDVVKSFREGHVVTIDLGKMDSHQAARLVDFCSGLSAIGSGWIFHVTDTVIVLTPST